MEILDQTDAQYPGRSVESVLNSGYTFKMSDYLNKAFKLFGNDAGNYIGFTIVSFVISMVVGMIPIIGSLAGLFLGPALNGGWYIFGQRHLSGQSRSFSNFFDAFKNPPLIQLVIGSLVVSILTVVIMGVVLVPAVLVIGPTFVADIMALQNNTNPDEVAAIVAALFTGKIMLVIILASLLGALIAVLYLFTPMFIIFRGMGFWEAMEASRKIVMKNYVQVLVFLIVLGIIVAVGAMLCGVGLLVAYPLFFLALLVAFDDIMGTGQVAADQSM